MRVNGARLSTDAVKATESSGEPEFKLASETAWTRAQAAAKFLKFSSFQN